MAPSNMKERSRFRFALFGVGRIGTVHFRNLLLNPRSEVIWIVEEDDVRAFDLLEQYKMGGKTSVCHISEMQRVLNDDRVDAVMVCTPSFTHEEIVMSALKAGKAVFCEKPLAPTIEATKAAYEQAEISNRPLFCAFNRRFDPQLSKLHDVVSSGKIGQLRYIHHTSRDPVSQMTELYLKNSGGILVDSVIHDIDMAMWLVGQVPKTVYAVGKATAPLYERCDDVDVCVLTMTFKNGTIVTINVCRDVTFGYDNRIEVVGTDAMITTDNKRPLEFTTWTETGSTTDPIYQGFVDRYAESYQLELEHFLDVLEGKTDMIVVKESTINVLKVINAAKASMREGQVKEFC